MKTLRIRMYNVGFGDCFLITLPERKVILVDCGFHSQGRGQFSGNELARQVIADVETVTGAKRIDVVIATHRHQDHVYAFNAADWDQVEVGEVWMPWVEDPDNAAARKLWRRKQAFAEQLKTLAFALAPQQRDDLAGYLWNAGHPLAPDQLPEQAAWSNNAALDRLIQGFARRDVALPRFLPTGRTFPESFESSILPDVKVHVLAPSRDSELLAKLDPEQDGETYKALALLASEGTHQPVVTPFADDWIANFPPAPHDLGPDEIDRLHDLARTADPLFAAQALDDMINATSLVLLLDVGKARLLLPGDAEWGTWKVILENNEARALLRGSTFVKIGHHGSHNATSPTLVEKVLPRRVPAMISTQEGPGKFRSNIPLHPLLDALREHDIRMLRSDLHPAPIPSGFKIDPSDRWIDLDLPC